MKNSELILWASEQMFDYGTETQSILTLKWWSKEWRPGGLYIFLLIYEITSEKLKEFAPMAMYI